MELLNYNTFSTTWLLLNYTIENFNQIYKKNQLSIEFDITIEEYFKILETEDFYMIITISPNVVEPIFNRNFGKTFHHHNGPNKIYHTHKQACYQNQSRHYHKSINFSPTHLKYKCQCCIFNSKEVREILMQHDGQLETCPFCGTLFIRENSTR